MTRLRSTLLFVAVAATVLASTNACAKPAAVAQHGGASVFSVGDCVKIPAGNPLTADSLHAAKVSCAVDPSYTVGAVADAAGDGPRAGARARTRAGPGC